MRKFLSLVIFATAIFTATTSSAQSIAQKSNADLAQNLMATNSSFASDLKVYGLLEMLENKGPYTVFAPSEELYKLAPEFTGEQKISYLKSYIVPQNITVKELAAQFKKHNNQIQFTTLSGNTISLTSEGDKVLVTVGSAATTIMVTAPQASNNGVIMQLEKMN